jgi:transcription initiation factor TFIIIB Brf1 subunit/transcription initiation factor TFIIB
MVHVAAVDGEYICVKCGRVFGSEEVAGIEETHSHYISHIEHGSKQISKYAYKLVTSLSLPDFALETIIHVADELIQAKVTQKQALLFATLYACREHHIPRLLGSILDAMRQVYGARIAESSTSLLKMLNKTTKKAYDLGYNIKSPDKYYYLKAYLAKIQSLVINGTNGEYYEYLRTRAFKTIERLDTGDPSHVAKNAIIFNTCRALQGKLLRVLTGDLNV